MRSDHPRSRGEYSRIRAVYFRWMGSSPLSRGIPRGPLPAPPTRRIIPALAGNTPGVWWRCHQSVDHPRSRGEYRAITAPQLGRHWIIPALAGNTYRHPSSPTTWSDHPRSRGEYYVDKANHIAHHGSSPLSRGIHRNQDKTRVLFRIIPALAGNTHIVAFHNFHIRDHPRSRGEYQWQSFWTPLPLGSSPLSRGIPGGHDRGYLVVRIIPALAGNTAVNSSCTLGGPDHPRSRGEYPC